MCGLNIIAVWFAATVVAALAAIAGWIPQGLAAMFIFPGGPAALYFSFTIDCTKWEQDRQLREVLREIEADERTSAKR